MADIEEDPLVTEDVEDENMGEVNGDEDNAPGGLENIEPILPEHTSFADYLQSPIVQLQIAGITTLSAHRAVLLASPYLAEICAGFDNSPNEPRIISLPDEDVTAAASVLEYLYRSDYFPKLAEKTHLEHDSSIPQPDDEGVALLRHARVYTLAKRLDLPALAGLAHRKIHLSASTAKGEIAYARYVYRETSPDDVTIRKPVAAFWAQRSHVLRHEAEHEFKSMCLEFPQFGYDVLNMVLDANERRQRLEPSSSAGGPGRKRQRTVL